MDAYAVVLLFCSLVKTVYHAIFPCNGVAPTSSSSSSQYGSILALYEHWFTLVSCSACILYPARKDKTKRKKKGHAA